MPGSPEEQRSILGVQFPPEWGIEPVPSEQRTLRLRDYFVLWSSLGAGLLVFAAGALLVPSLGLGQALFAIVIGTLIGNLLLALAGTIGSDTAVPTMVLLRPSLGRRGSYLPSLLNLAQLIGWTAFEFWVMAVAADHIGRSLFGFQNYMLWLVVFAAWCILLAIGGPLIVVRQWLEKFGVWVVYLVTLWLTAYLFLHHDLAALFQRPGEGGLPFWLAVDLVVAMPISWMPLVADYSRFARDSRSSFWGTYVGYFVTNVWFYGLGALFVLTIPLTDSSPAGLATAIMGMTGGLVALAIILVDETDNAFADIYSAAISTQNVLPQVSQRVLIVAAGLLGLGLAAFLSMDQYFGFLLLVGSVFVPLFGILAADYFVLRSRHYDVEALYAATGRYAYPMGINGVALVSWVFGVVLYHWIANNLPALGASIPSFVAAFLFYLLLAQLVVPVLTHSTRTR